MIRLTFLPRVVALPANPTPEAVENYLTRLCDLGGIIGEEWVRPVLSSELAIFLYDTMRYPSFGTLIAMWPPGMELIHAPGDIAQIVSSLYGNQTLEQELGIDSLLWDENCGVQLVPDLAGLGEIEEANEDQGLSFYAIFIILMLAYTLQQPNMANIIVVCKDLGDNHNVQANATITELLLLPDGLGVQPPGTLHVEQLISACSSFHELLLRVNAEAEWPMAFNCGREAIQSLLKIVWYQQEYAQDHGTEWEQCPQIRISGTFLQACERYQFNVDENKIGMLLNACGHVLASNGVIAHQDHRFIRDGHRWNLPDGNQAWRRWLLHANEGWRLHYWWHPNHKRYEFVYVCPHQETNFPEPEI